MKNKIHSFLATIATSALLALPLFADKPADKGKPSRAGGSKTEQSHKSENPAGPAHGSDVGDSANSSAEDKQATKSLRENAGAAKHAFDSDVRQILNNYSAQHKGWHQVNPLPPGLQKKVARGEGLPPGWQKKMVVGYQIPDSIWIYSRPLPDDIYHRYPHPEGTHDVLIEDKLYRIAKNTREIVDIIEDLPNSH